MRSLFAVSILSALLLSGCVSTKDEGAPLPEGEDPVAEGKAANEPCPAPLVAPAAAEEKASEQAAEEKTSEGNEGEVPAVAALPEGSKAADYGSGDDEPVKLEESAPAPVASEPVSPPAPTAETNPENPPAPAADVSDKPDVQSHIDVEAVPPEIPDRRDYYVTSAGLNVRSAPSAQSGIVRQLRLGEKVASFGREGIWVQIGDSEYVSIIYLSDRPVVGQESNASN